ncbi:hypothetical protein BH09BAC3_BH09BAC3_31820 [soil metagenome]
MKKIIVFLITTMLAGGCSLSDGTSNQQVTPVSLLSVYNANADADADVNMSLNSVQVNTTAIAYKTFLEYFQLDPGDKIIKFTTASSGAMVIDTSFTILGFKAYSLFLTKKKNSTKVVALFTKDEGTLVSKSNTLVRFINLSPDSPAVDVKFVGEPTVFASNVPFMQITAFTEILSLNQSVQIVRSSDGQLLTTATLSSTGAGSYQTIILSGYNSSPVGGANTLTTKVVHD